MKSRTIARRLIPLAAVAAGYLLGATGIVPVAASGAVIVALLIVAGLLLVPRSNPDLAIVSAVGESHRPADSDDGWREVRHELQRSRRLGEPMSLVRVDGAAADAGPIAERTREIDTVWTDGDGVCVLLPATGRRAADEFVSRLRADVASARPAATHRATFPDDALTGEALLAIVHGQSMPAPGSVADGRTATSAAGLSLVHVAVRSGADPGPPASASTTTTERTEIAGTYAGDADR